MAFVQELLDDKDLADKSAGGNALAPQRFRVSGLALGEDPTTVVGIPQQFATRIFGGKTYICDRVLGSARLSDTVADVICYWSTDGRWSAPEVRTKPSAQHKPYTITFQRVTVQAPRWTLSKEDYKDATGATKFGDVWNRGSEPRTFEIMVIAQTVVLLDLTGAQKAAAINTCKSLRGQFHQVPLFAPDVLQYQAPAIRETSPTRLEIGHVWHQDPGNSSRDYQGPETSSNCVLPGPRPAFGDYRWTEPVVVDGVTTVKPTVYAPTLARAQRVKEDGTLEANPLWNLNGYLTLPGGPLQ